MVKSGLGGQGLGPGSPFRNGPRRKKTCLRGFANNKVADQPAHLRSLINAFVIRFLKSIVSRIATNEISVFLLVSVAEETGLSITLSETRIGFVARMPKLSK